MIEVKDLIETNDDENIFIIATVSGIFESGLAKITIDGESEPSEKEYTFLEPYFPVVGDRVLMAKTHKTYVILGKISKKITDAEDTTNLDLESIKTEKLEVSDNAIINSLETKESKNEKLSSGKISTNELLTKKLNVDGESTFQQLATFNRYARFQNTVEFHSDVSFKKPFSLDKLDVNYDAKIKGNLDVSRNTNISGNLKHSGDMVGFFGSYGLSSRNRESLSYLNSNSDIKSVINQVNKIRQGLVNCGLFR